MAAGKSILDYSPKLTEECLQVLALLLSGIGEWRDSVVLIGGLTPHILVERKLPGARKYTGTGDIDLVMDIAIIGDPNAYSAFEAALQSQGFKPLGEEDKANWRWQYVTDSKTPIRLEFLMDDPNLDGSKVKPVPPHGVLAACNIRDSSIAFDLCETVTIEVELPGDRGVTKQKVRHANLVAFIALKIFAFRNRAEGKDAHDIIYCLQNCGLEMTVVAEKFVEALTGKHGAVIQRAIDDLAITFGNEAELEGFRKDGPARAALFEVEGGSAEDRERRILRQRDFATVVNSLLTEISKLRTK
jgi:hypothetical protein